MIPKTQIDKVIEYYDSTIIDYNLLWTGSKDLAIHFGYYTDETKNHSDSLLKMNEILAKYASISSKDKVLDAGCGYGGISIWLAKNIGCRIVGLNIVPYQLKKAKGYARKFNVSDKVNFQNQDYSNTSFPNESFDVVWGLESIVHAENKEKFIKEAFRLLKKKGRIIIAEYMLRDNPTLSNNEKNSIKPWLTGWALPSLLTSKEYRYSLMNAGFEDIKFVDITNKVKPSLNRLLKLIEFFYPIAKILNKLKIISNNHFGNIEASLVQINTLHRGLWKYIIVTAKKY